MFLIFRIVLILSAIGGALSITLIAIKPLTSRVFSAKWRYYIWIAVLLVMVFPIPSGHNTTAKPLPSAFLIPLQTQDELRTETSPDNEIHQKKQIIRIRWQTAVSWAWFLGMGVYFLSMTISYLRFLSLLKRSSQKADINISAVARTVGLTRIPPVKICPDISSPMLAGLIKPTVYLPDRNIDGCTHMVLMHELTHFRRHDLLYKWAALIVNGIHWFNPLSYVITAQINEECEISCDIEVIKNMSDDEKKKYMLTILNLIHG